MAALDNGSYSDWTINESNMKYVFDNYFKPYIDVVKECGSNKDGCWTQTKLLNNEKQFNGWIHSYGVGDGVYTFSSKDGMNINLDG